MYKRQGKYRIVDFPLSNCVNSNIDTGGIATQYQPQKLNEYSGNGQPGDLDRLHGDVYKRQVHQDCVLNGSALFHNNACAQHRVCLLYTSGFSRNFLKMNSWIIRLQIWARTVSYTHLDVYKRQVKMCRFVL